MLAKSDPQLISDAFANGKPKELFERYFSEQEERKRAVFIARLTNQVVGYVTLLLEARYNPFREQNTPEISDLNVLPQFRKRGIGTQLIKYCEQYSAREGFATIGLGVGLTHDYGDAINLYIKNGYIPDGRGITSHCRPVNFGENVILDDDLVLWFTKDI